MGSKGYRRLADAGLLLSGIFAEHGVSSFASHCVVGDTTPLSLEPGWYRIHLSGPWRQRDIVVHVDYGDGFWEADRVALEGRPGRMKGAISAPLLLPVTADKVRISWRLGHIGQPVAIGLHKASVARVFFQLLMHELGARPSGRFYELVSILLRRGRRGFGDWLYGRFAGTTTGELPELHARSGNPRSQPSAYAPRSDAASAMPLFSIVVPTYNTETRFLHSCIKSALSQTHQDWELCIADDCSTDPQVVETIRSYANTDARIKFIVRESNGHISAATNTALELATGTYVLFLDHDDELHPEALSELAAAVAQGPELDLIFTNEDKIDIEGKRSSPFLKTGYNPELLWAQNCVSHLGAYRRAVVGRLGGFRKGYEGSQDWDLALRVARHVGPQRICHIRRILYHWRTTSTSTAVSGAAKPYALSSALRAVEDDLGNSGNHSASVRPLLRLPGSQRVVFPISERGIRVSLIVFWEGRPTPRTRRRFIDLAQSKYLSLECLDALAVEERPGVRNGEVAYDEAPRSASKAKNIASSRALGEVLVFLDANVEGVSSGWLEEIVSQAVREDVGAVGGKMYGQDGRIRSGGYVVDREGVIHEPYRGMPGQHLGHANRARLAQNISAVTSSCMAVRRSAFEMIGGFDEALIEPYCSVDFCLRLGAAGLPTLWTPYAEFVHCGEGGASRISGYSAFDTVLPRQFDDWDGETDRAAERDSSRRLRWQEASKVELERKPRLA